MIDSHAHLDHANLSADLEAQLTRASQAGVSGWVVPGVNLEGREARRALRSRLSTTRFGNQVRFAVGVHPYGAARGMASRIADEALERALHDQALELDAVAIGETGFDRSRSEHVQALDQQELLFRASARVAQALALPLIVHVVKAEAELLAALKRFGPLAPRGVIHGFGGGPESAEQYVRRGFFISFGPALLRRVNYVESPLARAARAVPNSHILIETDAPDQASELAAAADVLGALAELRGVDREELGRVVQKNAQALFACSFGP